MSKTYHTWCTGVHLPLHPLLSVLPILLGISEFPDNTQSSFEKKTGKWVEKKQQFHENPTNVFIRPHFSIRQKAEIGFHQHDYVTGGMRLPNVDPNSARGNFYFLCRFRKKKGKLQSVVAYLWYRVPTQVKVVAAEATLRDDTSSKVILECAIVTSNVIILEDT